MQSIIAASWAVAAQTRTRWRQSIWRHRGRRDVRPHCLRRQRLRRRRRRRWIKRRARPVPARCPYGATKAAIMVARAPLLRPLTRQGPRANQARGSFLALSRAEAAIQQQQLLPARAAVIGEQHGRSLPSMDLARGRISAAGLAFPPWIHTRISAAGKGNAARQGPRCDGRRGAA